jgi:hypothetical protein
MLRERARAFLDSIAADQRPDLDSHSATYQAVRQLHPDVEAVDVELDPVLAQEFTEACAAHKTAGEAKRLQTSRVADVMGNARRAVCMGETVAIRISKQGGTPYVQAARKQARGNAA